MSLDIKKLKSKYKTRYRFRGNDFNELAEKWGIEIPDDLSLSDHKPIEEFLCSLLNDFLRHFNYEDTPDEEISKYLRMVANDIRKYRGSSSIAEDGIITDKSGRKSSIYKMTTPLFHSQWLLSV